MEKTHSTRVKAEHRMGCDGVAVARAVLAPGQTQGGKKQKEKKPAAAKPDKIGSWIVSYDDKGVPYWTNNSSEESTYRLLVQQTDHPVMPLRHVGDGGSPPWSLPLRAPPAKKKTRQGGGGESGSRNSSKKSNKKGGGGGDGDGNGHEDDGISRRGCWEELFDAVNGTKIWYNTVTRKKTSKDPFW